MIRPVITRFSEALAVWTPDVLQRLLVTGAQNNNAFSLLHRTSYAERPPTGMYVCEQDLAFYILKGTCSFHVNNYLSRVGEQRFDAREGDFVSIPRLTSMSIEFGNADTEYLQFCTPAGFDSLVMAESSPAQNLGPPPKDLPRPTPEQRDIIMSTYGLHRVEQKDEAVSSTKDARPGASIISTAVPYMINAETAPAYWVKPIMPELFTFYATAQQTNNQYSVCEIFFSEKGRACGPISYQTIGETYYQLSGTITFLCGDQTITLEPGDTRYLPPEFVQAVRIDSEGGAHALVFHTPPGVMEFSIAHMGSVLAKDRKKPPKEIPDSGIDMEMLILSMKNAGLKYVAVPDPLMEKEAKKE